MLESIFGKVAGQKSCNFIKKRLQDKCVFVNIAKFLRTPILKNICKRQLLNGLVIPSWNFLYCFKHYSSFVYYCREINRASVSKRQQLKADRLMLSLMLLISQHLAIYHLHRKLKSWYLQVFIMHILLILSNTLPSFQSSPSSIFFRSCSSVFSISLSWWYLVK